MNKPPKKEKKRKKILALCNTNGLTVTCPKCKYKIDLMHNRPAIWHREIILRGDPKTLFNKSFLCGRCLRTFIVEGTKYFDSPEEFHFYHWLLEGQNHGLICNIKYHPATYQLADKATVKVEQKLKTGTKIIDKFMFHPHSYTPDFEFCCSFGVLDHLFFGPLFLGTKTAIVDIKGKFSKHKDEKPFSLNQKWTWQKEKIHVQKIVPEKFFKETWVPKVCMFSRVKKQPVPKYIGCKNILEFIETLKKGE